MRYVKGAVSLLMAGWGLHLSGTIAASGVQALAVQGLGNARVRSLSLSVRIVWSFSSFFVSFNDSSLAFAQEGRKWSGDLFIPLNTKKMSHSRTGNAFLCER